MPDPKYRPAKVIIGDPRAGSPGRSRRSSTGSTRCLLSPGVVKKAAFVLVLLCTIGVVIALRWKVVNEGRPINPSPLSQIGTKTAEEWFADAVAAYGKGDRESALELAGFARTAGGCKRV